MTEMFLHADIQSVGNSAFEGCTAMTALIFEGTKAVNETDGISLGTGIITGTHADIKIFLPAITDLAVGTAYKTILEEKPTYYNFAGYGSATTTEEKTNPASYTLIPTVPVDTMRFTVKVESGNLGFCIPFPDSGNTPATITVSWGDGTPAVVVPKGTTLATGDKFEYTYAEAGTYTITIGSGATADKQQIPVLNFNQRGSSYNPNKLVSLETPLLNMNCSSLSKAFRICENLTTIPGNLFEKNTAATDFSNCFYYCKELQSIPGGLFASNTAAINFSTCFNHCDALTTIPESLFANNTEATKFSQCFADCTALTTIEARLFANNANINISYCFSGCTALTTISADLFANNTAIKSFNYCFYECTALKAIPEGLFAKNAEATNFNSCFYGCTYMMFNPNIFVDPTAAEQDKLNRFIDKDMDFRNCFYQVNLHNNSGTAPALWKYEKGSGQWKTTNCFKGCIMSNSEDITDYSAWGTPKF